MFGSSLLDGLGFGIGAGAALSVLAIGFVIWGLSHFGRCSIHDAADSLATVFRAMRRPSPVTNPGGARSLSSVHPLKEWKHLGGHYRIRLRERHLRDHLATLIAAKNPGVAKLDVVLRGLAALPGEDRPVGQVPPNIRWEQLHDLTRAGAYLAADTVLKRKWVSDKLSRLEEFGLLCRHSVPGGRPVITVLRDDGSGASFDDPTGAGEDSYVTFLAGLIAYKRLAGWGSTQLAACLAAMIAERYTRADPLQVQAFELNNLPLGGGRWYRPLSWFADRDGHRPAKHVRIPFTEGTLHHGLTQLRAEGLIGYRRIYEDPRTGRRFKYGRRVYRNGFDDAWPGSRWRLEQMVSPTDDREKPHLAPVQ